MDKYPGIQFIPPEGTVEDGAEEGEAMVKWKKVGDSYTITEFDGKPLAAESEDSESDMGSKMGIQMPADQELDQMASS